MEAATRHSDTILPSIDRVLGAAGLRPADLQAVAVTTGPGSFTGLRIGISTAKGLVLGTRVPLAGFSTLRILAEALLDRAPGGESPPAAVGLLPAGRGEIYRGLYRVRAGSSPWRAGAGGEERALLPEAALDRLEPGTILGGEGIGLLGDRELPGGIFLWEEPLPLAGTLALRVSALAEAGTLPSGPLEPNYIRPPDALQPRR